MLSLKNETQPLSLLLFCSWDRIQALMLIYTTNNRAIYMSSSERRRCETLLSYRWTRWTPPRGWTPPSRISCITMQRRPVYENDSFRYVTTGAESEQPVGAPCYQWVGCRDHAGITWFPHSESWQAQGGPAYICRHQRKHVFHNMGPLMENCPVVSLKVNGSPKSLGLMNQMSWHRATCCRDSSVRAKVMDLQTNITIPRVMVIAWQKPHQTSISMLNKIPPSIVFLNPICVCGLCVLLWIPDEPGLQDKPLQSH